MRLGIVTFGGDGGKSGISHYIIKLLEQFAEIPDAPECEVIVYEDEKTIFVPDSKNMKAVLYGDRWRNPVLNVAWHQFGLPLLCMRHKYDMLFMPAANRRMPYWVPCPTVGTVHDFSSTHVAEKYDPARMFFIKKVTPVLIRKLDMVLTVSENSKKDIASFCQIPDDQIIVTPNGVDLDIYYPRNKEESLKQLQSNYPITSPNILYVSRLEHPGKNHVGLIKAFNLFKQNTGLPHQLVLAGSKWSRAEEVYKLAAESPYSSDIAFIGFVAGADLPALYCASDLFVFPSLYEGFGMPILEAMGCGIPVACSNVSSMPEVAGNAALLFDPYDELDIALQLERMLTKDDLRSQCITRGLERSRSYGWRETAVKTLEVIRSTWEAHH